MPAPPPPYADSLVPFLNHDIRGGLSPARTVFDILHRSRSSLPSCTKRSLVPPGITANDSEIELMDAKGALFKFRRVAKVKQARPTDL